MLARLVARGKLPPVEERLPENPLVLHPIESIGRYGGALHSGMIANGLNEEMNRMMGMGKFLFYDATGTRIVPSVADDWRQSVERAPVDRIFHSPEHPYTRALLNSMPGLGAAAKQALPSISGTVPPAFRRPAGCSFHPRCLEFLEGTCNRREPEPVMVRPDQEVLCLRREPG